MKKLLIFIIVFFYFHFYLFSQIIEYSSMLNNILLANKEIQYVSPFLNYIETFGGFKNENSRREFINSPMILETNLSPYFYLLRPEVFKRNSFNAFVITFSPNINFRMYRNNNDINYSSPVRPMNAQPGISFKYFTNPNKNTFYRFPYFQLDVFHFSNGQQEKSTLFNRDVNIISGNYSTNYLKVGYTTNSFSKDYNLLISKGLFFRHEIWKDNTVFSRDDFQVKREAINRLGLFLQLRANNIQYGIKRLKKRVETFNVFDFLKDNFKQIVLNDQKDTLYIIKRLPAPKATFPRVHNLQLRVDTEYQLGNLDSFNYYGKNKLRSNMKTSVVYTQGHWNNLSIFFRHYIGRDYMNIRFTDFINYFQFGLVFEFKNYKSPNEVSYKEIKSNENYVYNPEYVKIESNDDLPLKPIIGNENVFITDKNKLYKIDYKYYKENEIVDNSFNLYKINLESNKYVIDSNKTFNARKIIKFK